MTLNQYGGTFVGFRTIREGGLKKNKEESQENKVEYPTLKEKPEKIIVTIVGVDNLKLPEVEEPGKRELVVTAIFDDDSIEESLTHVRQNSEIVQAKFLYDSYSASFNSQQLVLPCDDREVLCLYLSCITTSFLEDGTKRIEFKGYGYTKSISLSECLDHKQMKEELKLSDDTSIPGVKLTFRVVTTKMNLGPEIPKDNIARFVKKRHILFSVLDKYKRDST